MVMQKNNKELASNLCHFAKFLNYVHFGVYCLTDFTHTFPLVHVSLLLFPLASMLNDYFWHIRTSHSIQYVVITVLFGSICSVGPDDHAVAVDRIQNSFKSVNKV